MVARIVTGKSIKGAVNYNEEKLRKGNAILIGAEKYFKVPQELSFTDKLNRLERLAATNERTKTNCVHISLNFDPKERIPDKRLLQISRDYLQELGFGTQPYLVYRHNDAAHPHIHIVTTNIKADGKRIALHNIGREKSEPVRKIIEQKYGLIPAEGRELQQGSIIRPVDMEKAVYGKSETKNAISNIVRTVVRSYKYTSLPELNAALKGFNVMADRGEADSPMFKNKGLLYSLLDNSGKKVGVPIKASSIYTKPTLQDLEVHFAKNREIKKSYRESLKAAVDNTLVQLKNRTREAFVTALKSQNIDVLFRENATQVYGITFVDHRSRSVFNGSDIGKSYSAANLLRCIASGPDKTVGIYSNSEKLVKTTLKELDYKGGVACALAGFYEKGFYLTCSKEDSSATYLAGKRGDPHAHLFQLTAKLEAYFKINNVSENVLQRINEYTAEHIKAATPQLFSTASFIKLIQLLLQDQGQTQVYSTPPRKRKKRKR